MKLFEHIRAVLGEQSDLLGKLSPEAYAYPCPELGNATIGQHTRHILELFSTLLDQYETGTIDYDSRERNRTMETDPQYALLILGRILERIGKPDRVLQLNGEVGQFETNYFRELLYNLEHCIHHQALIRVALITQGYNLVSEQFGVAPSTLEYRRQCAR